MVNLKKKLEVLEQLNNQQVKKKGMPMWLIVILNIAFLFFVALASGFLFG